MSWTTSNLTQEDEKLLQQQTQVVNDFLISLGECPLTETAKDCPRLQAILDGNVLSKTDTWQLQCLGIALGSVMAKVLGLHWIIVTDEYGRFHCWPQTLFAPANQFSVATARSAGRAGR